METPKIWLWGFSSNVIEYLHKIVKCSYYKGVSKPLLSLVKFHNFARQVYSKNLAETNIDQIALRRADVTMIMIALVGEMAQCNARILINKRKTLMIQPFGTHHMVVKIESDSNICGSQTTAYAYTHILSSN